MADLYADENFSHDVVARLRLLGHDVITVQEAGEQGGSDPHVLAYATAAARAVLTFNRRHFIRLHTQVSWHCGIVICTDDDADALAARIHQEISGFLTLDNQLVRVNRPP